MLRRRVVKAGILLLIGPALVTGDKLARDRLLAEPECPTSAAAMLGKYLVTAVHAFNKNTVNAEQLSTAPSVAKIRTIKTTYSR